MFGETSFRREREFYGLARHYVPRPACDPLHMSAPLQNGVLDRLLCRDIPPIYPDPWPAEIDAAIRAPAAVPLCVNCLSPQSGHRWLCAQCACPVGDFAPLMPNLQPFCIGHIMRRGVIGPPDRRCGVNVFLCVMAFHQYAVFAPVYWFWLVRKWQGKPICEEKHWPVGFEAEDLV
jgi:hypothetical protein